MVNRRRILLAEDHPLMGDAIASVLCREFEVIAIVQNGNDVLPAAEEHSPEAIVLDVSMPGRSGLQILPELRIRSPFTAIIILTAHCESIYMEEAFRRGADEYVLKHNLLKDLLPSISTALFRRQDRDPRIRSSNQAIFPRAARSKHPWEGDAPIRSCPPIARSRPYSAESHFESTLKSLKCESSSKLNFSRRSRGENLHE
jgi:DNA-binding NarL/FixJ family response regulator